MDAEGPEEADIPLGFWRRGGRTSGELIVVHP